MLLKDLVPDDLAGEISVYFSSQDRFSIFEDYKSFQILLIRRLTVAEGKLGFLTESFLMRENDVYKYQAETESFERMPEGFVGLFDALESYYAKNQMLVSGYATEIERLEEYLFGRKIPGYFMDLWFDIKKDLSRIENFYFRNLIVYREFYRKKEKSFGELTDDYKDIEESIQFQTTTVQTLKSRLEGLHNYFESIKNDKLNKTLLTLTVISGVFLPLNLIVGFFGMNTEGLYFHGDPEGTQKVVMTLAAVLFVCLLGGKVIHLIDSYVLRYILGRYKLYQNILKRVTELDKHLKGQ